MESSYTELVITGVKLGLTDGWDTRCYWWAEMSLRQGLTEGHEKGVWVKGHWSQGSGLEMAKLPVIHLCQTGMACQVIRVMQSLWFYLTATYTLHISPTISLTGFQFFM